MARLGVLLFIFVCVLSFLNRSPYGEPSKAVAYAVDRGELNSVPSELLDGNSQRSWDANNKDEKPQKIWKKYVLDKVVLSLPLVLIYEKQHLNYHLRGVDRHTLSFRFSGLAPPYIV